MLVERRARRKPRENPQSKVKISPSLKDGSIFEVLSSKENLDDCWQETMETEQEIRRKKENKIMPQKSPEKSFSSIFSPLSNNRKNKKRTLISTDI